MNSKPDPSSSPQPLPEAEAAKVESRRQFARAGLAAPIVLGSFISRPVLGAVPYQCTVSGQVSGNLSRPSDIAVCKVGESLTTWQSSTPWPSQINKGTLPNNGCNFPPGQGGKGTAFNGFSQSGTQLLASVFYNSSDCTVTTTVSNNAATMLQVLHTTDSRLQFQLGRATVVSLLNFYKYGAGTYPVSDAVIIAMFNATHNGGSYMVNGSVPWNIGQVIQYLESLY